MKCLLGWYDRSWSPSVVRLHEQCTLSVEQSYGWRMPNGNRGFRFMSNLGACSSQCMLLSHLMMWESFLLSMLVLTLHSWSPLGRTWACGIRLVPTVRSAFQVTIHICECKGLQYKIHTTSDALKHLKLFTWQIVMTVPGAKTDTCVEYNETAGRLQQVSATDSRVW